MAYDSGVFLDCSVSNNISRREFHMTESHRDYRVPNRRLVEVTDVKIIEVERHIRLLEKLNPHSKYVIENINGMVWIVEDHK